MKDIGKFQSQLGKLMEKAKSNGNKIDSNTISEIFEDMELNDTQYKLIENYLEMNQIEVEGYEGNAKDFIPKTAESPEENKLMPKEINLKDSAYLAQYLEEIGDIREATAEEETKLLQGIRNGEGLAKSRFIETNLRKVSEIAIGYKNMGMTAEDLIQEGNIALIQSLEELPDTEDKESIIKYIYGKVRSGIEDALKLQQDSDVFENAILEKSNKIYRSLKELEEELGRKADINELAEYMKLSEEEIQDVLGLSADSVDLEDNHNH